MEYFYTTSKRMAKVFDILSEADENFVRRALVPLNKERAEKIIKKMEKKEKSVIFFA